MVFTQYFCAARGSENIRRNGSAGVHTKYLCKGYGHQARFTPAAVAKMAQYTQVDELLGERNPQRSIACVSGVSRVTIASRIKKAEMASPPLPRLRPKEEKRKEWEALELDQMGIFLGRKK